MKNYTIYFILIFAILSYSCEGENSKNKYNSENKQLTILATTSMLQDAVARVAGPDIVVNGLMGPGVDPHLYTPTLGSVNLLKSADVIFYNGLHLEGKMGDMLAQFAKQKPVFSVGERLDETRLLTIGKGGHDPHIWFDVSLWSEGVAVIAKRLSEVDPAHAADYASRAEAYQKELSILHQWVKDSIASIPEARRVLITAHDAFSYFGKAYDIEVRGLQGVSTQAEFGLKDVQNLVNFISDRGIKAVFVETSISSKSLESVVAGCKANGHDVVIGGSLYSDAMGERDGPAGTYTGMVKTNVMTIVKALR